MTRRARTPSNRPGHDYSRDMTPDAQSPGPAKAERAYDRLPPAVPLDEVIGSVDTRHVHDPEADRNGDQHRALRED